ncbi:MAG: NADPH:quinone oxidoreductase family protein [Burkholderiaceae bacterium]|nr:NADPH:quinone oxidoreductase family protein [Burkholderiaceae bacterium]
MKALLSLQPGDASTLQLLEVPDPVESADQLLVRVRACGVNYPDALHIQDLYQVKQKRPFSPGGELCGVVERVGSNVRGFAPGDLVIGRCGTGAMAEKIAIAADRCVKIPADSPVLEAAGLVLTYATAYYALVDRARLQPGETMLVLGAAGGVGCAAIDLGRALGARVVAAASSQAKLDFAMECGAQAGVVYPTQLDDKAAQKELTDRLKELVGPKGADVVYDPVGGPYTEAALRATGRDGRLLVVGFTAGIPRIPTNLVLLKVCQIVGVDWRDFTEQQPQRNAANVDELVRMWRAGQLRPRISQTFPLARASEAIAQLSARGAMGKLVIEIG